MHDQIAQHQHDPRPQLNELELYRSAVESEVQTVTKFGGFLIRKTDAGKRWFNGN